MGLRQGRTSWWQECVSEIVTHFKRARKQKDQKRV